MLTMRRTYTGVSEGDSNPPVFIPRLVELSKKGFILIDKISKRYRVDQFAEAVKAMKSGEVRTQRIYLRNGGVPHKRSMLAFQVIKPIIVFE
jgi:Zn-dependent alcohol dehydrogenase